MKKIKSIKSWLEYEDERFIKSIVEFNESGQEISKATYFGPDELECKTISTYTETGQLIEEINYGEENEETDRTTIERDSEGNPTKIIHTYADGSKTFKSQIKEEDGKLITVTEESDEGEFESLETIRLDDNGNVIERISYDENHNIIEKQTFNFTEQQNISSETDYRGEMKISETKYFYDEKENLVKRIILNAQGETIDWAIFTYDENGKLTEQQYGDHTLYKQEYNEKGLKIMEQKVNAMGVVDYIKKYSYNDSDELIEESDLATKATFEYEYY